MCITVLEGVDVSWYPVLMVALLRGNIEIGTFGKPNVTFPYEAFAWLDVLPAMFLKLHIN